MSDTAPPSQDLRHASAKADEAIAQITLVFDRFGERMYGEEVTELSHALQCADAAVRHEASDELVIATLLHDIGHLLHHRGEAIAEMGIDMHHEVLGEKLLRKFFPESVTRPVGLHVAAKRYLATVEDGYFEDLSLASKRSLELQGGQMTLDEIEDFEADPHFADAILLRRCDEEGKMTDSSPPTLDQYFSMIRRVIENAGIGQQ
jgi:[1-hydroxy-2-(trimethylamino)ethyl]phosphonate dioxygenase